MGLRVSVGWQDAQRYDQLCYVHGVMAREVPWDGRPLYVVSDGRLRASFASRQPATALQRWRRARAEMECGRPPERWRVFGGVRGVA